MNYQQDLPYEEIRAASGDYFDSLEQTIKETGLMPCHVWSVIDAEGTDGGEWIIYGPPHHFVNRLGFIATKERHNFDTYYEYEFRTGREVADLELENMAPDSSGPFTFDRGFD